MKESNRDFYWRNATASDTNCKMIGWKFGAANIVLSGIVVCNISGTGQVNLNNLPNNIPTNGTIEKLLIPEMHTIDREKIEHSNPNTPFRSHFSLPVMQKDKIIGHLYMGNAIEVAYNMAAPCCLHRGHKGYRLYWAYTENACTTRVFEKRTGATFSGEEKETTEEYDLDFKPGLNFIKTEIIENYGTDQFKTKKHKVVSKMPSNAKYFFWKN
ncbi:hypothetical protein [Maribacter halichondriae]|uniref:hypothetical protein n=1 Tax=Maribacter halichondriae TaxID=2980554 RepID=UPI00235993B7|nr:hypothetical protein [Maribacter sp. Hal144]